MALLGAAIASMWLASAPSAWAVANGQPDPAFGSGGIATLGSDTRLYGTAVQSDGKIVAVGASGFVGNSVHLIVVRFTTAGGLDPSFGGGQVVGPANLIGRGVAVQGDGKIVVGGVVSDPAGSSTGGMFAERFNSDGSPDGGFGSGGVSGALVGDNSAAAYGVALQGDGKVVLAGSGRIPGGPNGGYQGAALARINPNGSPDGSFGSGGATVADLGRFSVANGVAVQGDGRIVIGGSQRQDLQTTSLLAARFNTDGSLDGSFSGGLFLHQYASGASYSAANAVALQPDGSVVLAGAALDGAVGINTLVVRLTGGGAPDGGFGSGGAVKLRASDSASAATSQKAPYGALGVAVSAGQIFAAGYYDSFNLKRLALWGLTGNGSLDPGFGSGGATVFPGAPGTHSQANALAVVPGGNLALAGELDSQFGNIPTGFVGRFGGPFVPIPGPPAPPTPPAPKLASISRLRISPTSFPAADRGASIAATRKKRKTGTKISYNDSQAAVTTFTVLQPQAGIRKGKSCIKRPRRVRGKPKRCTRYVSLGTFTHRDKAGANSFHFTGRVRGRKLKPGSYRLQSVPRFAGRNGKATQISFRIVK